MIREIFEIVRDYVSGELEKIKSLEKHKRGEYIWDYHKWKLIISFGVVLCICGLIVQTVLHKDTIFNLAMINQRPDFSSDADLEAEFAEFFGADPDKAVVNVDSSYQIVPEKSEDNNVDYTDYEKFFLNVSHGEIDCAVAPESFVRHCVVDAGAAERLDEILTDTDMQSYECFELNGVSYGIYVSGGILVNENRVYPEMGKYVLFFPKGGRNDEYIKKLTGFLPEMIGGIAHVS